MGLLQFVNELLNQGQQVSVLVGHLIELPVVLHRLQGAILLLEEEEGGCHGTF